MQITSYFTPEKLSEAIRILEENEGSARIVAGGTDIILRAKRGVIPACKLVDVSKIEELNGVSVDSENNIHIGGCAKLAEITENPSILDQAPILAESARKIGSVQIRNMATLAGNIANASPSADTAPPLMVLGARVTVAGPQSEREIPVSEIFAGPGKTQLSPKEVIKEIVVPDQGKNVGLAYVKHSRRVVMDVATVNCAAKIVVDRQSGEIKDAVIAMGAVAPTPVLLVSVAETLKGSKLEKEIYPELTKKAFDSVSPIADVRSGLEYRKEMIGTVLKNTLAEAYQKAMKA